MAKKTKKITLSLVLSWIFGVLFGLDGLIFLFSGIITGGLSLIIASLILLPPVNKIIKEKWNFELSGGLKIILIIILLVIYAVNLPSSSIFSGSDVVVKSTGDNISAQTNINTQTQPPEPTELNLSIGETAKTSKIEVTVFSAQKAYSYDTDSFFGPTKAKPGKMFVFIDTEIKSVDSDRVFIDSDDFSMADSEGYRYDPEYYSGDDALESYKELYQNQKTKGRVLFVIPQNAEGLKVQYDFGNFFTKVKLASWIIE